MSQPRQPPALELVVITRNRLHEVIDEAVARGRITRGDAADLVADLIARARGQADGAPAPLDGDLPINGYDDLTAAQVAAELDGVSGADLRRVREYEKANANRKTVLAAIERRLA